MKSFTQDVECLLKLRVLLLETRVGSGGYFGGLIQKTSARKAGYSRVAVAT